MRSKTHPQRGNAKSLGLQRRITGSATPNRKVYNAKSLGRQRQIVRSAALNHWVGTFPPDQRIAVERREVAKTVEVLGITTAQQVK